MEGECHVVGRFFKVLMPGFEAILKLPPAFVRTLNNVDLDSEKAVLKSCRGSWRVGVKKNSDGLLHFYGENWKGYVSDHELKTRDLIVFEHMGDLLFNTLVFDETCCQKEFVDDSENDEDGDSSEDEVDSIEVEDIKRVENSQFRIRIAKSSLRGTLTVPIAFARSNALMQKGTVTLRNASGDSWFATLHVYYATEHNNGHRERVLITGVTGFFIENKVKVGDTCIFKLDHSLGNPKNVVMDVVFMRKQ